jgi:hypothetical protein
MHKMVMAFCFLAAPAFAVDTWFVHATNLNLRAAPNATAKVLAQIPIGAGCDLRARTVDGWAEMKCLGMVGFAKLELLGANSPDASVYALQAIRKGAPVAERLVAAGRALALRPTKQVSQDVFRTVFIEAEWNRLDGARQKKQLLKPEGVIAATGPCADAKSCVDAALNPGVAGVWTSVIMRGDDFLHALLWPDGVFRLRSGSYAAATKTITVQLESSSVPSRAVMVALQATAVDDVCAFLLPVDEDVRESFSSVGALCGYTFDQNCGPDPANCYQNDLQCEEQAGLRCSSCKVDCGGTCNTCRSQCASTAPTMRSACVAACAKAKDACASSCQQPNDAAKKVCDDTFKTCDAAVEQRCRGECVKFQACLDANKSKGGDAFDHCFQNEKPKTSECVEACVGN